jgi:hypothetical protein
MNDYYEKGIWKRQKGNLILGLIFIVVMLILYLLDIIQ